MPVRRVRIDRLQVRLQGVSPEAGGALTHGLGQQVLRQLAASEEVEKSTGHANIRQINAGTLTAGGGVTSSELGGMIARAIVRSINAKIDGPG